MNDKIVKVWTGDLDIIFIRECNRVHVRKNTCWDYKVRYKNKRNG